MRVLARLPAHHEGASNMNSTYIESRERSRHAQTKRWGEFGEWSKCEGTEGLSETEAMGLMYEWSKADGDDAHWLRVEYRIAGRVPLTLVA
jgi:hypothetical protein